MAVTLSVVVINYNATQLTIECIESMLAHTEPGLSWELLVVDNASEPPSYQQLLEWVQQHPWPQLKLIRHGINAGFGPGNMVGALQAQGQYIAFVNSDTLFVNDCFSILIDYLQQHPEVGIVGGQSFTENGSPMMAFDHFATWQRQLLGRDWLERICPQRYPKRKQQYAQPIEVNYVQGSFMLMRYADFAAVGGFDPYIFLYYEESDLSYRLWKRGKKSVLVPQAHYIHLHGGSTPKSLAIKMELKLSLLYVIRKHQGFWAYQLVLNYLKLRYALAAVFKPRYRALCALLWKGAPLHLSLRQSMSVRIDQQQAQRP